MGFKKRIAEVNMWSYKDLPISFLWWYLIELSFKDHDEDFLNLTLRVSQYEDIPVRRGHYYRLQIAHGDDNV